MKTVILRGPVLTQSGYGVHCRQIARWLLNRKDIDVKFIPLPWGDTPWLIDQNAEHGLIGEVMKKSTNEKSTADVSIQLQLPNEWNPKLAKFNIGVTASVETDRCNPEWVSACNNMDMIIVPSQHAKSSLTNSGLVLKPIVIVPEAYSDEIVAEKLHSNLPTFSTSFNFLVFGQLTGNNPNNDRKNLFYTLKWLCDIFKDDKDVGIVLKTNAGRNTKIDRRVIRNVIGNILTESRKGMFPRVHLLHGDMPNEEVAALYRHPQVKALVALTRGEGYGLPILEAAASGLPVIATGWSGHTDFLNKGKYVNIAYQLIDVHPSRIDGKIFVQGTRWANPSEEDAKKRIAKFRTSNDVPREWAKDLKMKLVNLYSFEAISKAYDEAIGSILC
jgi:glycosyltransferase involved in cell wall biosynthesis